MTKEMDGRMERLLYVIACDFVRNKKLQAEFEAWKQTDEAKMYEYIPDDMPDEKELLA